MGVRTIPSSPSIMPAQPVPESVLKKRKTQEKLASDKAAAAADAKKANKEKRIQMYKSAEKYVKEYRNLAKQRVRMHRQAKAAGNHFVDAKPSSPSLCASAVSMICTQRQRRSC